MLHKAPLVDGGLASNLPAWLFNAERDRDNLPVVAFDLTTRLKPGDGDVNTTQEFFANMIDTALESGDELLRRASGRLMYIEVPIDPEIRTLDFNLSEERRRALYSHGYRHASTYFNRAFGSEGVLRHPTGRFAVVYGEGVVFESALGGFLAEARAAFPASGRLRAAVILPTGVVDETGVIFSSGMSNDPDMDLTLKRLAGPAGFAVEQASPVIADWQSVKAAPESFRMTRAQAVRVPADRRAVASTPVFDLRRQLGVAGRVMSGLRIVGALSIDSDRAGPECGWTEENGVPTKEFLDLLRRWADVIGRILN
jgi:hypothetical protein